MSCSRIWSSLVIKDSLQGRYITVLAIIQRISYSTTPASIKVPKNMLLASIQFLQNVNLCALADKFIRFNLLNISRARSAYLQRLTPLPPELQKLPPQFALPSTNPIY